MQSIHSSQLSQRVLAWTVLALSIVTVCAMYAAIITG